MKLEHQGDLAAEGKLYRIRHSLAHVLAYVIQEMRPGTTLGFGPPIDDGFYYDFVLPEPITADDFPQIERRMREVIASGKAFERFELPAEEALRAIEQKGEPYKREYAAELVSKHGLDRLSFYRTGSFVDMCEGPHVADTTEIPADCFKLRSIAGAYWRGDSRNRMMTRVYAWAMESKQELDEHLRRLEEAARRDHKKLGQELELFVIDDEIGRGLPLWLPNGTVIRDELERLAREYEFHDGYVRVSTPHIARADLYRRTGHLPYYASSMYPLMQIHAEGGHDGDDADEARVREEYALRPMNCPHHHRIYASKKRSYRDLPIRLAEYGQVYRLEDSGALSGLLRVRGMCQNDAHIYCTPEQVHREFAAVMDLHVRLYRVLGLTDYFMRLSTWDPESPTRRDKFVDEPQAWQETQRIIQEVLDEMGLPWVEGPGEAAFYGPKVDVQFRSVTGREESASTNQLDFAIPRRLGLTYVGADDKEHEPYVIHRAPLGSHERFVAFLIERYAGVFPTWLAPVQVRLLPVTDRHADFCRKFVDDLRGDLVRAEVSATDQSLSRRIRDAAAMKVPNLFIVGDKELAADSVTWRRHGSNTQELVTRATAREELLRRIRTRDLEGR